MKIMDVTLRDGSYPVNFQFTEQDTYHVSRELEASGINYIEIGHGMGIGASSLKNGIAAAEDEEYLLAAKKAVSKAKIGMFCIPGVADINQIDRLAELGLDFVRIGTNVDQVAESADYIERAKKNGLLVMANYMKSYTTSKEDFAEQVKKSVAYGADVIYIVDSAGGMFPEQIKEYYDAIQSVAPVEVGFHGHNNLGLAVSNSLYAKQLGIEYIDCSLQGLGRSAGNTILEQFIAGCYKMDGQGTYDLERISCLGEAFVQRLLPKKGLSAVDLYCGLSDFHSSYLKHIYKYSKKNNVSPLELIWEYSRYDKVNLDEEKLDDIARRLPKQGNNTAAFYIEDFFGNEQGSR